MATESKGIHGTIAQRKAKTKQRTKPVCPPELRKLEAAFMRDIGMGTVEMYHEANLKLIRLGDEG